MSDKKEKVSGWDKAVAFYASQAYAVGIVYSLGAAVVIVGALFKIMHWPGAGIVLTCGMCTEALLFVMGIFEKPHATYHWENVFPQVVGHEAKPLAGAMAPAAPAAPATGAALPALSPEEVAKLQKGLKNLSETAANLSDLSAAAGAANKLAANIDAAAEATAQFAGSAEAANAYASNMNAMNTNVAALNSIYQLQLQQVQAVGNAAAEFQQNATQLAKQVADLNNVYGNMLSALA